MDILTTADLASARGVSRRQAQRLVAGGRIQGAARAGRSYVLDAREPSVQQGGERGRPWSSQSAWGALGVLSGCELVGLTAVQRRRLRTRLGEFDADGLERKVRGRVEWRRYRTTASGLAAAQEQLILTGASAAAALGVAAVGNDLARVHGYGTSALEADLVNTYAMVEDRAGNLAIAVPSLELQVDGPTMPQAIVAVDMMGADSERDRVVGRNWITEALALRRT